MRSRLILGLAVVLVLSMAVAAQAQGGRGNRGNARPAPPPDNRPFDPKDLSGYWISTVGGHALGTKAPPLTPAGTEAMKGRIPDTQNKLPGNAPWYQCNPMGFPRLVLDNEPIELVTLNDRVLQLFQWEWTLREFWLDGRQLPSGNNLEDLGPSWYGESVARWDGNTLVVQTTGLDERAWLDNNGNPKSFNAVFEERYQRTSFDTIELQISVTDPKFYTAPWVGAKRVYRRLPLSEVTFSGYKSLYSGNTDAICAPINEAEDYNKRIRDPAAFGPK
jgi:hypothetical protein